MALQKSINIISLLLTINTLYHLSSEASLAGNNTSESAFISENINNASRIVINFDLPDETSGIKNTNETHPNESDILKFILNRSETLSATESDISEATTTQSSSTTTNDTPTTSTTEIPTTTSNPQQLLIPPASINASIAQITNNGFKHKQGQIIIR